MGFIKNKSCNCIYTISDYFVKYIDIYKYNNKYSYKAINIIKIVWINVLSKF